MTAAPAPAETIEQVIARLGEIVDRCAARPSRLGYFAALYRKVTVSVQAGIAAGDFEDGERLERLDVIFANHHLTAYDAPVAGRPTTRAWRYAFLAADQWWPIVLQHLLLGMNAHISLDLGIAAARTGPAPVLPRLRGDFDRINAVLASLVDGVRRELV